MKKINRIFICFFVYLICFININAEYLADIVGKIYLSEPVIEGTTPKVKFSVRLRVEPGRGNITKQQHIDLKEWKWEDISNSFIKVKDLRNESGSANEVDFKEKGEILEAVEFTLSGTFLFDWNNKDKFGKRIKIGEMYSGNGNGNKNEFLGNVYLNLGKDDIEIVSSLGVKVLQHMDFGTIIAGTTGDTHNSGNPAKIKAKGLMNSNVKIIIPQYTIITNKKDSLTIALNFQEKEKISIEGNNQSTVRKIKNEDGEKDIGTTDEVVIHGRVQTNKNNGGIYTGEFKVRVEYDY